MPSSIAYQALLVRPHSLEYASMVWYPMNNKKIDNIWCSLSRVQPLVQHQQGNRDVALYSFNALFKTISVRQAAVPAQRTVTLEYDRSLERQVIKSF